MRQKRVFISLLLIIALLVLGIAYAEIQGINLTITGNAEAGVGEGKVNVQITSATAATESQTYITEEPVIGNDGTSVTFDVTGLNKEDQTATLNLVIENMSSDIAATLGQATIEWENDEWFSATFTPASTSLAKEGNTGDSTTAIVVVTLEKTPINATEAAAAKDTLTITIPANPVGNSN